MDADLHRDPTRRELIASGVAVATIGSVGGVLLGAGPATAAPPQTDADLLRTILSVELLAVFSYGQVLSSGKLSGDSDAVVRQLLGYEQAHIDILTAAIGKLGQQPPAAPADVAAADAELSVLHSGSSLASLNSEQDCLRLLIGVEGLTEGAYYVSISKFADPQLARTGASILAAEAQHWTALSGLLHPGDINKAVPGSFVEGST
jgi:Ferritin-like domain